MPPAFKLHSPETGTPYAIYVVAPETQPGPWPVVLCMDGDDQFESAVEAYLALRKTNQVPPVLLVGVGYGASYASGANKRGRDYTPTHNDEEPSSGGAEAFLNFLTATLWPELKRRYPVKSEPRGLAGYSLGSLFVLYALFQAKPFFTHHLAGSPSVWWDDCAVLRQAKALRAHQVALPATLFLSVGDQDSASMVGDLALLEDQLAAKPFEKLDVIARRFPGRHHFNALPDTYRAGWTTLFGLPE
ncbi:MAG: alpha/beta hydrolase-fold protein [Opitutaceae bacterium]